LFDDLFLLFYPLGKLVRMVFRSEPGFVFVSVEEFVELSLSKVGFVETVEFDRFFLVDIVVLFEEKGFETEELRWFVGSNSFVRRWTTAESAWICSSKTISLIDSI